MLDSLLVVLYSVVIFCSLPEGACLSEPWARLDTYRGTLGTFPVGVAFRQGSGLRLPLLINYYWEYLSQN